MPKQNMYAVYDDVAQIHFTPFPFATDEEAARMFANCVNQKDHKFAQNPGDYILYRVASWDEKTGKLEACANNLKIGLGTDFVKEELSF